MNVASALIEIEYCSMSAPSELKEIEYCGRNSTSGLIEIEYCGRNAASVRYRFITLSHWSFWLQLCVNCVVRMGWETIKTINLILFH